MHAQRAEVKSCAFCSRQRRASGSMPARPGRALACLGSRAHTNALGHRRVGQGRACARAFSLPASGRRDRSEGTGAIGGGDIYKMSGGAS